MERKEIVVLGVGNTLMSDEGIGVYVVRELMKLSNVFRQVDFVEIGSSLIGVLHTIAGRKKAILVDSVYMKESAGYIRRFLPEEVISNKIVTGLSMHEGDLLSVLELSLRLGERPKDVILFGIQPEKIELGDRLSDTLRHGLGGYAERVAEELLTSPRVK